MEITSSYYENLIKTVIEHSQADNWQSAVNEWEIVDVEEDKNSTESCVCGKENLTYLFTIRNRFNGKKLYPIGSTCIKKFERNDLDRDVDVQKKLLNLLHHIEKGGFLTLSSDFFSRELLRHLYEHQAFRATKFNKNNPENDYLFMRDMFNKRELNAKQKGKVNAIIAESLRPYLQEKLRRRNEEKFQREKQKQ